MRAPRVAGQHSRQKSAATDDNPLKTELQNAWQRASPHGTTIVAVLVAVLVPLKVLRVVHGDVTVALAVTQYADKTAVLTGLLLLAAPLLLAVCFAGTAFGMAHAFAAIHVAARPKLRPNLEAEGFAFAQLRRLLRHAAALAVEVWLMIAVTPYSYALFSFIAVPLVAVVVYRSRRKPKRDVKPPHWLNHLGPVGLAGLLTGVVAAVSLLIVDQPLTQALNDRVWLPAHTLTLKTGPSVVGYVLTDDGAHLHVLEDQSRTMRDVPTADVTGAALCDTAAAVDSRSLWDLLDGKARATTNVCQP